MSSRSDLPEFGPHGVPLDENERVVATIRNEVDDDRVSFTIRAEPGSRLSVGRGGTVLAVVAEHRDDRQPDPEETPGRREDDPERREKRPNPRDFTEPGTIERMEKPELGELRNCTILVNGEELEDARRMTEEEARAVAQYLYDAEGRSSDVYEIVRSLGVVDG